MAKLVEIKMTFGGALDALKKGLYVARAGWNAPGMHLYLFEQPGFAPCIVMWTAQKTHQPGWLASQADLLANDWCTVHPIEGLRAARN